jgi:serine/threonine-protein kinase
MGEVFLARDASLERNVAVKVLSDRERSEPDARDRFLLEARAAAAIDHPFVCKVYEVGADDELPFICMEYVPGHSLDHHVPPAGMALAEVLRLGREIAEGLGAAHRRGVIHRDLKPSNIMIAPDGHVKVMDFGLAKWVRGAAGPEHDTLTRQGTIVGTPAYMSPEQALGQRVDHRSDIFSLGTLLYQMASGLQPFQRPEVIHTMWAIVNDDPPPLGVRRTDCPTDLERVVGRMLRKHPGDRYGSVDDLLADLAALSGGAHSIAPATERPRVGSIAVLPFVNMSDDKEHEYFSDGITEEIITQLSRLPDIRVISRTTVMRYKGSDKDLRTIGRELAVDTIVEGSVRWAGSRIRVSSKLVEVAEDHQVWADSFDHSYDDAFAVQVNVSRRIAAALQTGSAASLAETLVARPPRANEAYHLYLKGRHLLANTTPDNLAKAVEYFGRAIEMDPAFARAWAGLATCHVTSGYLNFRPIPEVFPEARAAAQKAIELDETITEAHTAMALVLLFIDRDWQASAAAFRKAIMLDPRHAEARLLHSWYLAAHGRLEDAVAEARLATELDPLSPLASTNLAWMLYYAGRYDESVTHLNEILGMIPGFPPARATLACVYLVQGRHDEAIEIFQEAFWTRAQLAQAYAMVGRRDDALDLLRTIESSEPGPGDTPFEMALGYLMLDDIDRAFEWIERAKTLGDPKLIFLKHLKPIERHVSHPRLVALFRELGLES